MEYASRASYVHARLTTEAVGTECYVFDNAMSKYLTYSVLSRTNRMGASKVTKHHTRKGTRETETNDTKGGRPYNVQVSAHAVSVQSTSAKWCIRRQEKQPEEE